MKRLILWLLVLLLCQSIFATITDRLFEAAQQHYTVGNYRQAKLNLTNMENLDKQDPEYALLMGKVCLALGEYKEAYSWLDLFKNSNQGMDPVTDSDLMDLIDDAARAQQFTDLSLLAGSPKGAINTGDSEYAPILTSNGKYMYLSSLRRSVFGKENVFVSYMKDKYWTEPKEIEELCTDYNESIGSLSNDGNTAYLFGYYNSKQTNGDIFYSNLINSRWTKPQLIKEVSSDYFDLQPFVFNGNVMFLTSNRAGNHDNYDIYVSELINGNWTAPISLGNVINTNVDEQAAFLDFDGKTLYFTSKGHNGFGGDDIFKSVRTGKGWTEWSKPENLGPIINSVKDDRYFVITKDQGFAYYSSSRFNGNGLEDIYCIDWAYYNQIMDKVADQKLAEWKARQKADTTAVYDILVNGIVVDEDDNPITTKVTFDYHQKAQPQTQVISSGTDGRFSFPLTCTLDRLSYLCKPRGYEKAEKIVDLTQIETQRDTIPILFIKITCKRSDDAQMEATDIRMSGKVIDEKNKPVLTNVYWYYVYNDEMNEIIVETNEDGNYKFYVPRIAQIKYMIKDPRYIPQEEMQYLDPEINAYDQKIRVISTSNDVIIKGKVVDQNDSTLVADLYWTYTSGDQTMETHVTSKPDGTYSVSIPKMAKVNYRVEKKNYMQVTGTLNLPPEKIEHNQDFVLNKLDISKSFRLDNVLFDFNKATLLKSSYDVLNPVVATMKDNPTLNIELSGHTDNVGGKAYNQKLSESRAKACADYLISKGIDKGRIVSKGYGMDMPVADNKTDAGRAKNRRTELKVLSIEFQPDQSEQMVNGFENAQNLPLITKTIKADRGDATTTAITPAMQDVFMQKVKESVGTQKGELTIELFVSKGNIQSVKSYVKSGAFSDETLNLIATKLMGWKVETDKSFIHTMDVSVK